MRRHPAEPPQGRKAARVSRLWRVCGGSSLFTLAYSGAVIFYAIGDSRPYPDHGYTAADWAALAPRSVRLDELITTRATLDLHTLLTKESTFFGDLFAHVVRWRGELYLEDGLHRAVRTALSQRPTMHARILDLDGH